MIIDRLPALPSAPTTGDELPIERGTGAYKIDYNALASAIIAQTQRDIAIVVEGNKTTHTGGAAAGAYVIVHNSTISGITDGLYKATQTIPANTAITSVYLTAVDGGGLNELNGVIGNLGKTLKTVTGDGVKTYAALMYELLGSMPVNPEKTFIVQDNKRIYRCFNKAAKEYIQIDGYDTGYASILIRVIASGLYYEGAGSFALTNYSSSVVASGTTFSLVAYG